MPAVKYVRAKVIFSNSANVHIEQFQRHIPTAEFESTQQW